VNKRLVDHGELAIGKGQIATGFLDFRVPGQDDIAPVTGPVTIQSPDDVAQMSKWPAFTVKLVTSLVETHGPKHITVIVSRRTMTLHTTRRSKTVREVNRVLLDACKFVLAPKAENIIPVYSEHSEPAPKVSQQRRMTYADYIS
jgi:hypothetical protein